MILISNAFFPADDGGKGIFSMVNIKSVEEYEDEEYDDYSDDDDVFEVTTFHPNSVLPADAVDKAPPTTKMTVAAFGGTNHMKKKLFLEKVPDKEQGWVLLSSASLKLYGQKLGLRTNNRYCYC